MPPKGESALFYFGPVPNSIRESLREGARLFQNDPDVHPRLALDRQEDDEVGAFELVIQTHSRGPGAFPVQHDLGLWAVPIFHKEDGIDDGSGGAARETEVEASR